MMSRLLCLFVLFILCLSAHSSSAQLAQESTSSNSIRATRTGILSSYPSLFSPLTILFLVPILFILLSIFLQPHPYGRAAASRSAPLNNMWNPFQSFDVQTLARQVMTAIESDTCRQRYVCMLGKQVKYLGGAKQMLFGALETMAPQNLQSWINLVKESASSDDTDRFCSFFSCSVASAAPPQPNYNFSADPRMVAPDNSIHSDTVVSQKE